jgi:methionyl-tRNA formyltransferase
VYLTTDDPLYLPAFFERVLDATQAHASTVYVVPPLYKEQTALDAAKRYARTFGLEGLRGLIPRVLTAKVRRRSIGAVCERREVPHARVADVNSAGFLAQLRAYEPDLIVSVSCPQIFKRSLIEIPRLGCLNIHGAILPDYRGVLPSFWMLANGEREAGVTIFYVNEDVDAGDVCAQVRFDIAPDVTLHTFLERSKAIAADLLVETLERVERGDAERRPLDMAAGSYFSWPDREAVDRFRAAGRRLW